MCPTLIRETYSLVFKESVYSHVFFVSPVAD